MTLSEKITKRMREIVEHERETLPTNLPNEHDNWNVVRDSVEWNGYEWVLVLQLQHKQELDVVKFYKVVPLNKRK